MTVDIIKDFVTTFIMSVTPFYVAWLSYNQYSKNKKTDFELESLKKKDSDSHLKFTENVTNIYGELWQLLAETEATRVYIIQPHPIHSAVFVSVLYEVCQRGVSGMKGVILNIEIINAIKFVNMLEANNLFVSNNLDRDLDSDYMKSVFNSMGTESIVIKKLINHNNNWAGSLVVEYKKSKQVTDEVNRLIGYTANTIQYILPDYV